MEAVEDDRFTPLRALRRLERAIGPLATELVDHLRTHDDARLRELLEAVGDARLVLASEEEDAATREPFAEVVTRAYGWTVDERGYLAGLTAGDMGYEWTDARLTDLLVNAQVAEDRRNRDRLAAGEKLTPNDWPVAKRINAFVLAAARSIARE